MDEIERLSFEQQLALQEQRLAVQTGEEAATLAELAGLPFVTKAELLAAQADDPPLGRHAGAPQEEIVRMHVTSGTTGTPLLIGFTAGDLERSSLAGARAFR